MSSGFNRSMLRLYVEVKQRRKQGSGNEHWSRRKLDNDMGVESYVVIFGTR
jgi:hypothetical protein